MDIDLAEFSRQLRAILKKVDKAEIERMYHSGYDVETAVKVLRAIKEGYGTR